MAASKPADCRACDAPIAQVAKGRTRRYCGDACRQRWCRQRARQKAEAVVHIKRASRNAA